MLRRDFIKRLAWASVVPLVGPRGAFCEESPGKMTNWSSRGWFIRSMSCAEAMVTILNRGAGIELADLEQATHPLAGGLLAQGHICGMLLGTALATGVRSRGMIDDEETAGAAALSAMIKLTDEFRNLAGAVNCRELIGGSLTTLPGELRYAVSGKTFSCTRLAVKWSPVANELIDREIEAFDIDRLRRPPRNCAMEVTRRCSEGLGIEIDPALAAAFAGGVGLEGNACGALAAGVFSLGIKYYRGGGKSREGMLKAALQEIGIGDEFKIAPERFRREFLASYGSELCSDITGKKFASVDDHSSYVAGGGCGELIDTLSRLVRE